MKLKVICSLLAVLLAIGSACNRPSETTSNAGPDKTSLPDANGPANARANSNMSTTANRDNAVSEDFWSEAAVGGMAEVELGRLASTKAQNADVKQFAQMMITDHSKANDELKAVAGRKNVTLPTSLGAKHQATLQKLQGLSGAEFDKAYVDEMLKDHQEDVQMFEKQAEGGSDADAKAFAAKTLPTLRKHLDAIQGIQAKMK